MTDSNNMEQIRVSLAEIKGGVQLIDSKLDASNRIHDERHQQVREDITDLRERVHRNANHIQGLHAWRATVEGERKGFAISGKVIWVAAGLVPTALVAAILRAMGA